jgi:adenylate kinase
MPLRVVMLGPPASGKGTQAARLARARRIPQISTGDILRGVAASATELGSRVKALIDRGELVGDGEMTAIVEERLARPDAADGYILDGFPRTVPQARALDGMPSGKGLVIIELAAGDAELLRRMEGRRVCSRCAAIAEPGLTRGDACVRCGGAMVTREDDRDAGVRQRRIEVYARESRPLLDYYRGRPTFRSIDAAQTPDRVEQEIAVSIDAMRPVAGSRDEP